MIANEVYARLREAENRHMSIVDELDGTASLARRKVLQAALDLSRLAIEYNQRCLDALYPDEASH